MLVTSTPPYFSTTRGDESRQILRFQRQMHGLERIKVYTLRPDLSMHLDPWGFRWKGHRWRHEHGLEISRGFGRLIRRRMRGRGR